MWCGHTASNCRILLTTTFQRSFWRALQGAPRQLRPSYDAQLERVTTAQGARPQLWRLCSHIHQREAAPSQRHAHYITGNIPCMRHRKTAIWQDCLKICIWEWLASSIEGNDNKLIGNVLASHHLVWIQLKLDAWLGPPFWTMLCWCRDSLLSKEYQCLHESIT